MLIIFSYEILTILRYHLLFFLVLFAVIFWAFRACTEVDIQARTVSTAVVAIENIVNVYARDAINLPAASVHRILMDHRVELIG
jgi:hypothetical protein